MFTSIVELAAITLALFFVIAVFVIIGIRLRKYGGSYTTLIQGSTYEFLNKDRREASKEIIELKTGKKTEEQSIDKQF